MRTRLSGQIARGRIGEPADISGVIAALLGDGMGRVTAQRIEASGGMLIWPPGSGQFDRADYLRVT